MRDIAEGLLVWIIVTSLVVGLAGSLYGIATATDNIAVAVSTLLAVFWTLFLLAILGFIGEAVRRG